MDEAKKLRSALDRERGKRGRIGKGGFSGALRERVVEFIHREKARGRTIEELVKAIGVNRPTAYAWMRGNRRQPSPAFRQVRVVPTGAIQVSSRRDISTAENDQFSEEGCRVVVMENGKVVVLGMSVSEVAELLRRLGC